MPTPRLPEELMDSIVDLLRNDRKALKICCLVSKSWIPRARTHLFTDIEIPTVTRLQSWKATFPDPNTSPARYAKFLYVKCPQAVVVADREEGGWIPTFSRVECLSIFIPCLRAGEPAISLLPFHGFSPVIKSLSLENYSLPSSQIFNLAYSFRLLEDLSLFTSTDLSTHEDGGFDEKPIPIQPPLTGSLTLSAQDRAHLIVSRLLSLPDGLRFRELNLGCNYEEDTLSMTTLVERCCSTLESLAIGGSDLGAHLSSGIDLSKATKLKDVLIWCDESPQWVVRTLRTITNNHKNLQRISFDASYTFCDGANVSPGDPVGFTLDIGVDHREWLEFDHVLVQLRESHSIRPKFSYTIPAWMDGTGVGSYLKKLLPKATARGVVDLVQEREEWEL